MTTLWTHVALFVVDGLRPDALARADTPTMDRLMASGAHTLTARTVMPSVTLPCHASLFLGVEPARHGITTNTWTPQVRPVPGLFEQVTQSGRRAASFYNWEQLRDLSRPGALAASFFLNNNHLADGTGDRELAALAAEWLSANEAHFCFLYLGCTDSAGHDHGWMSAPYLSTIASADRCIAHVLDVLPSDCAVVITSDHGGHARSHGTDADEDLTIPLIVHGPGVSPGQQIEGPVSILDIAPTVARRMGLSVPREWEGRDLLLDDTAD